MAKSLFAGTRGQARWLKSKTPSLTQSSSTSRPHDARARSPFPRRALSPQPTVHQLIRAMCRCERPSTPRGLWSPQPPSPSHTSAICVHSFRCKDRCLNWCSRKTRSNTRSVKGGTRFVPCPAAPLFLVPSVKRRDVLQRVVGTKKASAVLESNKAAT